MKAIYTTAEYVDYIKTQLKRKRGDVWLRTDGGYFAMTQYIETARADAKWLKEYKLREEGKRIRLPAVYRVRFERVK